MRLRRWGVERAMGIEPTLVAWEATVLPLNYARTVHNRIALGVGINLSRTGGSRPAWREPFAGSLLAQLETPAHR
jgi:hypothetical protein